MVFTTFYFTALLKALHKNTKIMLVFKYNGFGGYTYVGIYIYILLEMPIRVLLNRCYGLCPLKSHLIFTVRTP